MHWHHPTFSVVISATGLSTPKAYTIKFLSPYIDSYNHSTPMTYVDSHRAKTFLSHPDHVIGDRPKCTSQERMHHAKSTSSIKQTDDRSHTVF